MLQYDWDSEFLGLNANEMYEKWVKIYTDVCKINIPITKIKIGRRKPQWLDSNIKSLIKRKSNSWYKLKAKNFSGSRAGAVARAKASAEKKKQNRLNKSLKQEIKKAVIAFEKELAKKSKENPKAVYAYFNSKTKVRENIKALLNMDSIVTIKGK